MMNTIGRRWFSQSIYEMKAYIADSPSAPLQLKKTSIPRITHPSQVLIKVKAASVNPLDTVMIDGYGNEILTKWKQIASLDAGKSRFPLIPGRDCAGIVEAVGGGVEQFSPGDKVMAVVPAIEQGSHAEYVLTDSSLCAVLPSGLDFVQAASLPYAASTAWAALVTVARMDYTKKPKERVLVHGGAGGVGSIAIQLLKSWGVEKVVATCSADSFELVKSLGAHPIDYRAQNVTDQIIAQGPFEVILSCVDSDLSRWSDKTLGIWRNCVHVSVVSPLLRETDRNGVLPGLFTTFYQYLNRSCQSALSGRWFSYAFFMPNPTCIQQLARFADEKKIRPIVEKVYSFEELPSAYDKVKNLHGRGKTVIQF